MSLKQEKFWSSWPRDEWKSSLLKENSERKEKFGKQVRKRVLKNYLNNIFFYFHLHYTPSSKVTYSTRKLSASQLAKPFWAGAFWMFLFSECMGIGWIHLVLSSSCDVLVSILTKLLPVRRNNENSSEVYYVRDHIPRWAVYLH